MVWPLILGIVAVCGCGRSGFEPSLDGRVDVENLPPTAPALIRPSIGGIVVGSTPALSARFEDPDTGQTGTLELEICTSAVAPDETCGAGELVATCVTTEVSSGEAGTCASSSALPAVGTYYYRARGTDDRAGQSEWSNARAFTYRTAPRLVHVDGMEHGLSCSAADRFGLYSGNSQEAGGTLQSSSTIKRSGVYSLRVHQSSANIVGCDVVPATGPTPQRVLRVAVYVDVPPPTVGNDPDIVDLGSFGISHGAINLVGGTTPYLRAHFIGGPIVAGPAIVRGRWYVIEMRIDVGSTTWTLDWRVDGVDQTGLIYNGGGVAPTNDIVLGVLRANAIGTVIHFDDLVVSAAPGDYPIGDGGVVGVRIDGNGSHAGVASFEQTVDGVSWNALSGSDWPHVSEIPVLRGGGFGAVRQFAIDATAFVEYQLEDPPIDANDPNGLTPYFFTRASSTSSNAFSMRISDGVAEATVADDVSSGNGVDLNAWYRGQPTATSGQPWTSTELAALRLRFGYATSVTAVPQLDAAMVQVDYPR